MMMMPFVRLLAIYALAGAAIYAFLNRDELVEYFAAPEIQRAEAAGPQPQLLPPAPAPTAQTLDEKETAPVPAPRPVIQAVPAAPMPLPAHRPGQNRPRAFGSEITPQYFGQAAAPVAAPAPAASRPNNMISRWVKARETFSQGNITEAAALYEALTTDFPQSADLHGETGNLYYNLGQFNKAATHYFAVGDISAQNGNAGMANSMLNLLQRIAPAKAAELQGIIAAYR